MTKWRIKWERRNDLDRRPWMVTYTSGPHEFRMFQYGWRRPFDFQLCAERALSRINSHLRKVLAEIEAA